MDRAELLITRSIHDAMIGHCAETAPCEACGILAGVGESRAESIYRLRNELESATRYNADPRDLIKAIVSMREQGERMVAIYHSHPVSAAVPSRVDHEQNHYGLLPRLIVSLRAEAPEVRIWCLSEGDSSEVAWRIVPDIEPETVSR